MDQAWYEREERRMLLLVNAALEKVIVPRGRMSWKAGNNEKARRRGAFVSRVQKLPSLPGEDDNGIMIARDQARIYH